MGQSFATDRDLTLPARPRLIPELIALPLGADGVMFVGAEAPQVLRGRSARGVLPRLLPLLNGEHTLSEIAETQPALSATDLRDIVSLLFSRGLLEDGRPRASVSEPLADVASFIGRHIDASRRHPNREAVLQRLATATVSVLGPTPLAESLAADLRAAGVGCVDINCQADASSTLIIVMSTGGSTDVAPTVHADVGAQLLLVRLGRSEAHIGPLLIDAVTACPECVARAHPHPAGEPDALRAAMWTGLASLYAFLALTQLPPGPLLRGFRVERFEDGELIEETRLAVRLPGCPRCDMSGERWAPRDARMLAWIYHCATSLGTRAMLSPKDHQAHYLVENARLASDERRLIWSPEAQPLSEGNVSLSPACARPAATSTPSREELHRSTIAALLVRMAGEVAEGGSASRRRRLVPTGGNLGSVNVWVIARRVAGLPSGAYLFDASRQALDFVRPVDDDALRCALRTSAPLPDCVLIGAGALATCASKYGAFAYRLIHLDSGVALAFAYLVASALGLEIREYADFGLDLPRIFGIPRRWEVPLATFAIGIGLNAFAADPGSMGHPVETAPPPLVGPADYSSDVLARLLDDAAVPPDHPTPWAPATSRPRSPAWAHSLETLDAILFARRAVREFGPESIARDLLERLTASAGDALDRRLTAGAPPCLVRPVLAVAVAADALSAGLYEADPAAGGLRRRGAFSRSLSVECSNQESLAAAPVSLFMIGDLRSALTERGSRAYSELAVHAGAAIGHAWLWATSVGMVGTAAGGVISGGLRRAAGMDGFNECPLLALNLGRPPAGRMS